jgi:hypothetical protein
MVASSNYAAISGSSSLCHATLGLLLFGGTSLLLCPNLNYRTTVGSSYDALGIAYFLAKFNVHQEVINGLEFACKGTFKI